MNHSHKNIYNEMKKYEFDISKIANERWNEEWREAITTTKNQQKAQLKKKKNK